MNSEEPQTIPKWNREQYREINELKMKINNIKEEVTQDMENLKKKKIKQKHKTEWKATMEDQNKWKKESQNSKIK
jgi:hypothetical protein